MFCILNYTAMNPDKCLNVLKQVVSRCSQAIQLQSRTSIVTTKMHTLPLCEGQCGGTKQLVANLKKHIAEGRHVACPVKGCKSVFTAKMSFTSHMSKKHRLWSENVICASINKMYCESTSAPLQPDSVLDAEDTVGEWSDFSNLYLRNMCMFYMKLQGQHFLPVSTIQNIIEEMQNMHELGHTYTLSQLNLKDIPISEED